MLDVLIIELLLTLLGLPMEPLGLPMVPMGTNVSTNCNFGTNGSIGYRETLRVLWLPPVSLVKFPMVQLGESRMKGHGRAALHSLDYGVNVEK